MICIKIRPDNLFVDSLTGEPSLNIDNSTDYLEPQDDIHFHVDHGIVLFSEEPSIIDHQSMSHPSQVNDRNENVVDHQTDHLRGLLGSRSPLLQLKNYRSLIIIQ